MKNLLNGSDNTLPTKYFHHRIICSLFLEGSHRGTCFLLNGLYLGMDWLTFYDIQVNRWVGLEMQLHKFMDECQCT